MKIELDYTDNADTMPKEPEMADDPRLIKVFAIIRSLIAEERAKTIADMLKATSGCIGKPDNAFTK